MEWVEHRDSLPFNYRVCNETRLFLSIVLLFSTELKVYTLLAILHLHDTDTVSLKISYIWSQSLKNANLLDLQFTELKIGISLL